MSCTKYKRELEAKEKKICAKIKEIEQEREKHDMNKDEFWTLSDQLRLLMIDKMTVITRIEGLNRRFTGIMPVTIDENQFLNKTK